MAIQSDYPLKRYTLMNTERSIQKELALLIFFVFLGFATIAYLSYQNMNKMKKNLDLVYFGSYIQVVKLKSIKEAYYDDLLETVIKVKKGLIGKDEALFILSQTTKTVQDNWNYYRFSYKTDDEQPIIAHANAQIEASLKEITAIQGIIASGNQKKIDAIAYEHILRVTDNIANALNPLIEYENDSAYQLKSSMNDEYEKLIYMTYLIIGIVFIAGLVIAFFIIRNIHKDHELLKKQGLELKKANKALQEISITDPLTKIYNRRFFDLIFSRELSRATREKINFSFIMLDIDHFKQYNDTYGHGQGDEVLKTVAKTLKSKLKRSSDFIFRLGGEEFGVMFTSLNEVKSENFAASLLKAVEEVKIVHEKNSASPYVTVSMGMIHLIPDEKTEGAKLIEIADKALYKAKENGRNQLACVMMQNKEKATG